jgi:hypothetical protein
MIRRASPRIGVVFAYVLATLAFAWPLPLHLGTAFTGDPGGDTGVYVWNQWVFQHEAVVERHSPLSTELILSLTDRVDLSQHNYTAFLNLMALPAMPWLGVVATFNLVFFAVTVLTALATYALARRVTSATRLEAWLAGLAFAWSPVLVARAAGHFSLVAAAPLPVFVLCLINADRSRRPRDAALTGLAVAWAAFCDVYYAVYCLLIASGYLASRALRVTRARGDTRAPWRWTAMRPTTRITYPLWTRMAVPARGARQEILATSQGSAGYQGQSLGWLLNVLIVSIAGLVAGIAMSGGGRFTLLGVPVSMRGLYTPVLILTVLVIVRIALQARPHLSVLVVRPSAQTARTMIVAIIACVGPLSPVLYGLGTRLMDGRLVNPPTLWRSSPRGVDLLALFEPNPSHAAVRWVSDRQAADATAFVEYTAAMSLVAITVIAIAIWKAQYRPRDGWVWLTLGFAALSLGPFLHVGGINTHIPGPWALLRYVPILGAARTPTRFTVVAALGLAVLLAGALAALGRRFPRLRGRLAVAAGICLAFELSPMPRTLYSAEIPSLYRIIAGDPRPVRVLQLPFGIRDGVSSAGNFSARYQYFQTLHGKKLVGGYLSRISKKRLGEVRAQPTLDALLVMSEGQRLSADHAAWIRARGPRFISRANVGYVVIDHATAPPYLVDFAVDAWGLEEIAREGTRTLFRPTVGSETGQPPRD